MEDRDIEKCRDDMKRILDDVVADMPKSTTEESQTRMLVHLKASILIHKWYIERKYGDDKKR